ncbi:hypothetical protein G9A89_020445 [Geosiphon pyriformis]|nr:hypothetical protein G9A89_020445 [Geosiphon pyriformis]
MTNVHDNKKKGLGIAKAVPIYINSISIETDMEVSEAKEYTIIVGNEWLKKTKALLDYEFYEQLDELDDEESNEKKDQEETVELTYIIFISNSKPLNNIKADRKKIIVNNKLICWPYYDIFKRIFDRKSGKKAKYSYW